MLTFETYPPLARGLFAGLLYAFMVWMLGVLEAGPVAEDLWTRVFFALAAGLAFQQVTDGAVLMRGEWSLGNPHRWMYGYVLGAAFAAIMILAFWGSEERSLRVVTTWGLSGVFFGLVMAFWPGKPVENADVIAVHYRTKQPQFARSPFLTFIYFAWPFVTWGIIYALVTAGGYPGIGQSFIWYMMIFFIAINAAYRPKGDLKAQILTPMSIGLVIMVGVLFLT